MKRLLIFLCMAASVLQAGDFQVIEITDFSHRNIDSRVFQVKSRIDVTIRATGAFGTRDHDEPVAKAWIVNTSDRSLVWEFSRKNAKRKTNYTAIETSTLSLNPGYYELYFAVNPRYPWGENVNSFGDVMRAILGSSRRRRSINRAAGSWGVNLTISEDNKGAVILAERPSADPDRISICPADDNMSDSQGFSVSRPCRLKILAIGEGTTRYMDDYAWIVDEGRTKVIWKMEYNNSVHAGGAAKNRMVDTEIQLQPGMYRVYYVTDNSHSFEEWNAMPPYNPPYYGVSLWCKGAVKTEYSPFEQSGRENILVDMSRMGDRREERSFFEIKRPMNVSILALGEMSGRDFVDYGRIVNADTREVVWKMTRSNTDHAGGGRKNRMFLNTVALEKGVYEAVYVSDGSHAFDDWNEAPPFSPEAWGMRIWPEQGKDGSWSRQLSSDYRSPDLLVDILEVSNSEHRKKILKLSQRSKVRIYAVGEAESDDDMYDYGWIEDEDGRVIWRMDYYKTVHAGGARKNRKVTEELSLDAGTYYVYYVTDGSHAYGRWNDTAPDDPGFWGISVWKAGME